MIAGDIQPSIRRVFGFRLAEVCRIIRDGFEFAVLDDFVYPFGIGCIALEDVNIRDNLIREGPHPFTEDSSFSLLPHDQGLE